MLKAISSWFQIALDFVFPAECAYCHNFVGDDRVLIFCKPCWETISLITPPRCPRCGKPYTSNTVLHHAPNFTCGECRKSSPFFDRAFAAAYYEGVLKEAIHQFKFQRKTGLGKHLAQWFISQLTDAVDISSYQIILPVPLHKSRQKQRGYNQSAILAKYLAQHYQRHLLLNNLLRIRHTDAQSLLQGRQKRQENVKNAFRVKFPASIHNQHLILVDDVFTTGATVNECAKVLKQAGARTVLVLTLSRADFGPSHLMPKPGEGSV